MLANRQRQHILILTRWQITAPVVPTYTGLIVLPTCHTRVAPFGVRQPCVRSNRAHDPAMATLNRQVTRMLWVLITFIASVSNPELLPYVTTEARRTQRMGGYNQSYRLESRSGVSMGIGCYPNRSFSHVARRYAQRRAVHPGSQPP